MEQNIKDAIALLKENGYIIKKLTKAMKRDADECETSNCEKECLGCACNVCIIQ